MLRVRPDQIVECDTPEEAKAYLATIDVAVIDAASNSTGSVIRRKQNRPEKVRPGEKGWQQYLGYLTRKQMKKTGESFLKARSRISREHKEKYAK